MAPWNRASNLVDAIEDWVARGLLPSQTGEILKADVASNRKSRSFSSIIVMLGVICLAFAAMTFVAANWDIMSNLTRLLLVGAGMWATWGLSIWLKHRGNDFLANLFVMLACAVFGASIMLVGQIFHIQGEPRDAVWLWAAGTLTGAVATRSIPALALAVMLVCLWTFMGRGWTGPFSKVEYIFLLYWGLCAAAAWWMASRFSAHVLAMAMAAWILVSSVAWFDFGKSTDMTFLLVSLFAAFVAISLALYSDGAGKWLRNFELPAILYLMFVIAGLVTIWYFATDKLGSGDWHLIQTAYWPGMAGSLFAVALAFFGHQHDNPNRYDMIVTAVFAAIASILSGFLHRIPFVMETFMLAMSIWTIRMGWRLEYRALSTFGFIGFSCVMLLIYFMTVGTLIGTSGFYLGAGLLLLLGALVLPKLLRRGVRT
jgi:uncharacterized membrane protein